MPGNISQNPNMQRTMHAISPNSSDSAPNHFHTDTMSHDGAFSGYHVSNANQQGILAASSDMSFSLIDPHHRTASSASGSSVSAASGTSRRGNWFHAGTHPYSSSSRSRSHKAVESLRPQSVALPSPRCDMDITKIIYYQTNRPIWGTVLGLQSHIVNFHTWERPFMTVTLQEFGRWNREALEWHGERSYGERSSKVPEALGKWFILIIIQSY
jgi:hypothetical protein